jgi:uncharacterized membrane protein YdcZ (DUF606 family)
MTEEQAKRRFFLLAGIRLSGVLIAFFGIAVVMKRLIEPADIIGTALIAIGAFEVMVLPTLLLRSWRSKD